MLHMRLTLLGIISVGILAAVASGVAMYAYSSTILGASVPTTPKVTWKDSSGNVITSITLSFATPGSASRTVTFTCSPSAGPVSLRLTFSLSSLVTLSLSDFQSCASTPNVVTLTASSATAVSADGTLRITQPANYRALAVPLGVLVVAN